MLIDALADSAGLGTAVREAVPLLVHTCPSYPNGLIGGACFLDDQDGYFFFF